MADDDAGAAFDAFSDDEWSGVLGGPNGSHERTESAADLDGGHDAADLDALQQREAELAARVYDGAPHPADAAGAPDVEISEAARDIAKIGAEFWPAKPILQTIRQHAYARRVSPWAVLGEVLVRVMTFVPAQVQLPELIGGPASLNLLLAVVCKPGFGKGTAAASADRAVRFPHPVRGYPIGSGEGLVDIFATTCAKGAQTWHTRAAMISVAEVDHLTAEAGRSSATIGPYLRQSYMAEGLGGSYRTKTSKAYLKPHSYRLTMSVGVQPKRAGLLLGDADGGTPQRFLWMPGTDPMCPRIKPEIPGPIEWRLPVAFDLPGLSDDPDAPLPDPLLLHVCDEARAKVDDDQWARQSEHDVDPMETHANLGRLKWAAALATLCHDWKARDAGTPGVTAEFWDLADLLMRVSSITRQRVADTISAEARAQNEAAGFAEASRAGIVADAAEARKINKTCDRIITKLTDKPVEWSHSDLRTAVGTAYRDYYTDALDKLANAGRIERRSVEYHGSTGWRYRLAGVAARDDNEG